MREKHSQIKNEREDKKMKVVVKEPSKAPVEKDIENTLEALQELVGGWIEFTAYNGCDVIVNEEGKLMGLEPNLVNEYGDVLVGTVVFVGEADDEGELTDVNVDKIMRMF
jgi:hypothetical protein